jgi:N-acetylglucosaminyldiphosphoundecaprenol N-acetyl-beta-D-mannosaminyltransferase
MKFGVLNTKVDLTSYEHSTQTILNWACAGESRMVIAANVHTIMEAYDSPGFKEIVNNADLVAPDGMPLVWMMRLKGLRDQRRVYGPALMLHVLEASARAKVPVGFYGGAPKTLNLLIERLQARYEGLNVAYFCSPSFGAVSKEEDAVIVDEINHSGARILFIGLGCPKQEIWMAKHRGVVNAVMLGVGAAFDFHAGVKAQAPAWLQKVGLEWIFRLFTEPRRLWKRYLYHNPRFIVLAVADLWGLLKRAD